MRLHPRDPELHRFLTDSPSQALMAEAEREQARLALKEARKSGDTRTIHVCSERLRACTEKALGAGGR